MGDRKCSHDSQVGQKAGQVAWAKTYEQSFYLTENLTSNLHTFEGLKQNSCRICLRPNQSVALLAYLPSNLDNTRDPAALSLRAPAHSYLSQLLCHLSGIWCGISLRLLSVKEA